MATWRPENSMLTQRGVEILNKLKAGVGSITVTRIVAGSERVAESLLFKQTSISGVQKPMTISGKNTTDVGSEITFYIENKDFTEPYNLHQIGIYVTHPDYVGEQLYHISQCDANDYDTIPAISYTPVTQGYSVFMEHGNSSSVNITVDPSGMINTVQFNEFKESVNSLITDLTNGKAPAGFGLGESEGKTINALDDIDGFGFYQIPTDSGIAPDTNSNWGAAFVGANINYGTLIASRAGGLIATRTKSGVWADRWEWVNPPMEIGVEYCTTERIKGKAVYKKNVNGVIQYRLDGETDWKPYANAVGASESQKYMFMVSSKESRTIDTKGWYRVCSIDLSPDSYYDGTSFIMSISHVQSGSTAEALQVLVNCNKENPNIIVLGGGSGHLCYSKVRLTFDQTNTKFNFDIYWNANFQNQAQAPNFIVFLNGRHTLKSHEEIFTAIPLNLIDTLPSTESVIKEHIVKPIGSGNILTDKSGVKKSGDTMTGKLFTSASNGAFGASTDSGAIRIDGGTSYDKGAFLTLFGKEHSESGQFQLVANNGNTRKELKGTPSGSLTWYGKTILHTGNKPSGSYTGNGSATARTIKVGGLGEAILIHSTNDFALVCYNGAILKVGTDVIGITQSEVKYEKGVLTIKSTRSVLNTNGVTYYYQVL